MAISCIPGGVTRPYWLLLCLLWCPNRVLSKVCSAMFRVAACVAKCLLCCTHRHFTDDHRYKPKATHPPTTPDNCSPENADGVVCAPPKQREVPDTITATSVFGRSNKQQCNQARLDYQRKPKALTRHDLNNYADDNPILCLP